MTQQLESFSDLEGCTLASIENKDNEELIFTLDDGRVYKLYHNQSCCETVEIEDIVGELEWLIGIPIVMAQESESDDKTIPRKDERDNYYTWTFYKLATSQGYVTIRWYGTSNGYYSESVDWCGVSDVAWNY